MSDTQDQQETRDNLFRNAVRNGDLPIIRTLLEKRVTTSVPADVGSLALVLATLKGDLETTKLLLAAGVDPSTPNSRKETPLYWAVENGHNEIVQLLLKAGANPNGTPTKAPIWGAVLRGNREAVDFLLNAGAKTDPTDSGGANLLHKAAENGHQHVVRRLLDAGMKIDDTDIGRSTVLHYAARGSSIMVRLLISLGADVNARDVHERTPLLITARRAQAASFDALVEAGADPLARDDIGRNAFDLALDRQKDVMAVTLLERYPALAPTGEALDKAFVLAIRSGCIGTVKKLAALGADVGQKPNGRSLLQCAPSRGATAEELKRVLRSFKSGALLTSAMGDGADTPTASHTPTL